MKLHELGYPTVPFMRLNSQLGSTDLTVEQIHTPGPPEGDLLDQLRDPLGSPGDSSPEGVVPGGSPIVAKSSGITPGGKDDPNVGAQGGSEDPAERVDQVMPASTQVRRGFTLHVEVLHPGLASVWAWTEASRHLGWDAKSWHALYLWSRYGVWQTGSADRSTWQAGRCADAMFDLMPRPDLADASQQI